MFDFGRKRKPTQCLMSFQGRQRGFREVLKRVFANQRSVTKGRPANAAAAVSQQGRQACSTAAWLVKIFIAILKLSVYPPLSQATADEKTAIFTRQQGPTSLTNGPSSSSLVVDAFLHRQHGLSPFQQLLLLYGLSVCVRVLQITSSYLNTLLAKAPTL